MCSSDLTLIRPEDVATRIWPLEVRRIPGVGPKADERLASMQIRSIGQLAQTPLPLLSAAFGARYAGWLHEAAHGYVARHFGDMTAHAAGRISLNPLRHIDWLGTIAVPLLTLLFTPIMFGWAKPVPVNFGNLRHPKRDMLWVAAAGPLSNQIGRAHV